MAGGSLPASGVLLLDKPVRWSSYDGVAFVRALVGARRVGHAGTLDPLATGLLIVLYGDATKLAEDAHRAPKAYLARIALGFETTTDDLEGEPLEIVGVPPLDAREVRTALASFVGSRDQVTPAHSAVHVRGERAYERARRGEPVALGPRRVELFDLRLAALGPSSLDVLVTCSAGTYVRAIARDLARAVGTRGHLAALRRVASGHLVVEAAATPERLRAAAAAGELAERILTGDALHGRLTGAELAAGTARRLLAEGSRSPSTSAGGRSE